MSLLVKLLETASTVALRTVQLGAEQQESVRRKKKPTCTPCAVYARTDAIKQKFTPMRKKP